MHVVRSICNEALDQFILIGKTQIENIINDYASYYNSMRPISVLVPFPEVSLLTLRSLTSQLVTSKKNPFSVAFIIITTGKPPKNSQKFSLNFVSA